MEKYLVGVTEIAEMLGISRQRADQLSRTKGFPDPYQEMANGRVWTSESVSAWAEAVRRHFCIPAGGPAAHGGATTMPCEVCGRVWEWQGLAWKNSTPTYLDR